MEQEQERSQEEVIAWMNNYRMAMDRLTVDKLLSTNLTSLTLRMALAKHSRTALSPVVGEVLRAVISRANSETTEKRQNEIKLQRIINFYASTDYTQFRQNTQKGIRTEGNEAWYGEIDSNGTFVNRWQSPLRKSSYCGEEGFLEPPLVKKSVQVKDKRGETQFDEDDNELYQMQERPTSMHDWMRENGQFSIRTFGSMGTGEMKLNGPLNISATTSNLPKHAICRMVITDTGNNRVQVWTLMKEHSKCETLKFNGLVGLNTLFAERRWSDDETEEEMNENALKLGKGKLTGADADADPLTPEMVIKQQQAKMQRKRREHEHVKIRSTFGSRRGQFANPRGVTFGASRIDSMRIFITDNTIDKHLGSPRVQVIELDGINEAKVSYVIDNGSIGTKSMSRSLIMPVHSVKPGGESEFIFTDCNGLPILAEQKDRIVVTVPNHLVKGSSSSSSSTHDRVRGYCWTFPRHVREFPLETMMLCCLKPQHSCNELVRKWFNCLNREPKQENSSYHKSRRERVAFIEAKMNEEDYADGVKPHFALHYFQHELVEHLTGSSDKPTIASVHQCFDDLNDAFVDGLPFKHQASSDDEELVMDLLTSMLTLGQNFIEGESMFQEGFSDGGSSLSVSSTTASRIRQSSRIPPTYHSTRGPTALSLKTIRLHCLSRFLRDQSAMLKLVETIQMKISQQGQMIQKSYSKIGSQDSVISTDLELETLILFKEGCVQKLQQLVAEMMFALLLRQIRVYEQLEDSYVFEPCDEPGKIIYVPRSAIRGVSMQAYFCTHASEIGTWIEGTVIGLDRETGLYCFEHDTSATKHQQVKLISRSKLRVSVPQCKNLFSLPWGMCQAKNNGYGHLVVSDNELDCLHVFDGGENVSDDRTVEEKGLDQFEKDDTRQYLYTIGRRGTLRGEFHGPKGICFDHANRLIVADSNNNRIQGFEYLVEAGGNYADPLHTGIAPGSKKGGRWICTFIYPEEDHSQRGHVGTPGTRGCAAHVTKHTHDMPSLSRPSDVTVDDHENIIVADTGNSCIRILRRKVYYGPNEQVEPATVDRKDLWMYKQTLMGKLVRVWPYVYIECIATWGCRGYGPGTFISPTSIEYYSVNIAIKDSKTKQTRRRHEDRYLVVDQGSHNVTQFTVVPPDPHIKFSGDDTLRTIAVKQQLKSKNKERRGSRRSSRSSKCSVS